jgi:hypothetical protein
MLRAFSDHQLEILDETGGQCVVLVEILFAAGPGVRRIENL